MSNIYVGSYGQRYSDPTAILIGRSISAVEAAIEQSIADEHRELAAYCEHESAYVWEDGITRCFGPDDPCPTCEEYGSGQCSLCDPDIVEYGAYPVHNVEMLGGYKLAREAIAELRSAERWIRNLGEGREPPIAAVHISN